MKTLKKLNKIRRDIKAISPVISVLLMIAIAVVASLVTYAWVMGYMSFTTTKVGKAIQIQSIDGAGSTVYVQNVGDSDVAFSGSCVYVGGVGYTPSTGLGNLAKGATVGLNIGGTGGLASIAPGSIVKVTSTDGTFSQVTYTP